jgi:membrane-bound metal-dependent hydrolase YbcI (DUF457 family)
MFTGHWGAAWLIAAVWAPASPAVLFLLAQLQDLVQYITGPILHWEIMSRAAVPPNPVLPHIHFEALPYSHSLFSTLAVFIPVGFAVAGTPGAAAVVSHMLLDALVHFPPMIDPCWPLVDGCGRVSLGLWRFKWLSLGIEAAIVVMGAAAYTARARKRARAALSDRMAPEASMAIRKTVLFAVAMVALTFSLPFQPPPPTLDWPLGVQFLAIDVAAAWFAGSIDGDWVRYTNQKAA